MVASRPQFAPDSPPSSGGAVGSAQPPIGRTDLPNRLNLLLSWADWRTESWVDLLDAVLRPMGVESVRARSASEAERVIRTIPVHIAIVDLRIPLQETSPPAGAARGTPEEGGPRVLELLRRLEQPPPTVVVKHARTGREEPRHLSAALRSDAFAVVDRTGANLEQMLRIMQRVLHRFYENRWPSGADGGAATDETSPRRGGPMGGVGGLT